MTPVDTPPPQYLTERTINIARHHPSASATSGGQGPQVIKILLSAPAADWLRPAIAQISGLTALARGWNSYGAPPVEADCALQAVEFLLGVAQPHVPSPTIVPLTDGGIQVEWHQGGIDLEISFSDFESGVYIEDREGGAAVELPLADAPGVLARFAARLATA